MIRYKSTIERILETVQGQIRIQNEDTINYGHRSDQATISRALLNNTLYALEISDVVSRNIYYHYRGQIITGLDLSVDGHRCFVSETDYEIYD